MKPMTTIRCRQRRPGFGTGDWMLSTQILDRPGHVIGNQPVLNVVVPKAGSSCVQT
jgi:hypothetical protein